MKTAEEILKLINDEGVEFVRLQFTDMLGRLKNVAVTAGQLRKLLVDKYRIDGSVLFCMEGAYDGELLLKPDFDTFMILPWRPQQGKVAKIMCDICNQDGTLFEKSSRTILKNVIEQAKAKGYTFMIRPECEFFLFHTDEDGLPTTITHEQAGLMDVGPVDFGENARREMVLLLDQMGFEIESSHHEKAPAQHEIDFKESTTLQTADSIITFRFSVRSIAKRFGLYATFMPKPKANEEGSGMHLNISIYKDGVNIMDDMTDGVKGEAGQFINGIVAHAKALSIYANPTVNSYKRLMHAIKDPASDEEVKRNRTYYRMRKSLFEPAIELSFPDSSSNPYLVLALCIACGLNGIEAGMSDECPDKMYLSQIENLPRTLGAAVTAAKEDEFVADIVGKEFARLYEKKRNQEWNEYLEQVSEWELDKYLYQV